MSRERNESPGAGIRTKPPLVPEQLAAGALGALLLAMGDGVRVAIGTPSTSKGDVALAVLHTIALYLPAGLAVGLAAAALIAILRASPAVAPFRARLASVHLWFVPAPRLVAGALGTLAGVGLVALVAHRAHEYLATVAHRVDLASWAMAGIMAAALAAGFLAATAVRALLARALRYAGRLASPGALVVCLLGASTWAVSAWIRRHSEIIDPYGLALALVPSSLAAYALGAFTMRALLRRTRRATLLAGMVVALTLGAWTASALTYGQANTVRTIVEEETAAGRWLLRRYMRITDLDGDRHAWGFGGRDCDDFDARVHPGTRDEPGDGVDLDCFAGDGAPVVAMPSGGHYGARPPQLAARPSFVLITIDALRPDHLSVEGYDRDTSPNIDAFARTAVRFRETLAPSSRSIRSIPGMFTGLYPSQIAYGDEYLYPALLGENTLLAEVLKEHGWQTAVTMGTEYFHRVRGFFQGFDAIEEVLEYKPSREQTVDRALAQLSELSATGQPFFQWIHLFHVHGPYLRPPHPSRYGPRSVDAYDTEIRLADEQVERILITLRERGLDRDTVVILASDHGEAFREHGRSGHANTLYQEELDATLMIRVPGVTSRRVDATVSLLDLTPTVLNLADVPLPHPMWGQSLVGLITGERAADRDRWFFGELLPDGMFPFDIKMIRRGDMKLHWWVNDGTIQMFDLAHDPHERRDLSDVRTDEATELLGTLQAWVARSSREEQRNAAFVHDHTLAQAPAHMTHPLGLSYPGLFTVLGCDIPETDVVAGETLDVTCYYRVDGETDQDLFFRVVFDPPRGYVMPRDVHAMHYPLHGRYHTNEWRAGEILVDPMPIPLPSYMHAPVDLDLTFSVESRGTGARGLLSYEQHGRPGSTARLARIHLSPPEEAEPHGTDAGVHDAGAHDAGTRDAGRHEAPPP